MTLLSKTNKDASNKRAPRQTATFIKVPWEEVYYAMTKSSASDPWRTNTINNVAATELTVNYLMRRTYCEGIYRDTIENLLLYEQVALPKVIWGSEIWHCPHTKEAPRDSSTDIFSKHVNRSRMKLTGTASGNATGESLACELGRLPPIEFLDFRQLRHYVRILTLPDHSLSKRLLLALIKSKNEQTSPEEDSLPSHLHSAASTLSLLNDKHEAKLECFILKGGLKNTHEQSAEIYKKNFCDAVGCKLSKKTKDSRPSMTRREPETPTQPSSQGPDPSHQK